MKRIQASIAVTLFAFCAVFILQSGDALAGKKHKKQKQAAAQQAPSGEWQLCCRSVPHGGYDICGKYMFKAGNIGTKETEPGGDNPDNRFYWRMEGGKLSIYNGVDESNKPIGDPRVFTWEAAQKCYLDEPRPYGPEGTVMSTCRLKK